MILVLFIYREGEVYMNTYDLGLHPFGDQIIVEPEVREKSAAGIFLPEPQKGQPVQGHIRAIGPGSGKKEDESLLKLLKVGMKVLCRQYTGTEFEVSGKQYLILRASDIMCEVTK